MLVAVVAARLYLQRRSSELAISKSVVRILVLFALVQGLVMRGSVIRCLQGFRCIM